MAIEGTAGMRPPLQSRSQASTTSVLDAVLQIVRTEGRNALTIAAVSRVSGVSNGSIFHRFTDRDGLLVAAQEKFLSDVEAVLTRRGEALAGVDEPRELLRQLVEAFSDVFADNAALFRAFVIGGFDVPSMRERGAESARRGGDSVARRLMRSYECSPDAAFAAYRLLYSAVMVAAIFPATEITTYESLAPFENTHLVSALDAVLRS